MSDRGDTPSYHPQHGMPVACCSPLEPSHNWQDSGCYLSAVVPEDEVWSTIGQRSPVIPVQSCIRCGMLRIKPKETP